MGYINFKGERSVRSTLFFLVPLFYLPGVFSLGDLYPGYSSTILDVTKRITNPKGSGKAPVWYK
jgi:hypothetical protein